MHDLEKILTNYSPITLDEMDSVKLMNRIDTKFVLPLTILPTLLHEAKDQYYAQEINGKHIALYDSIYYDTDNLDMYMRHHDRQLTRQKIRIRQYVDSNLTFLEIKRKNNKGRTKKKRISIPGFEIDGNSLGKGKETISVADFIAQKSNYSWDTISPHLRTTFHRITLVNKNKTERLTIDFDIAWENQITHTQTNYPHLAIIELKRNGHTPSPMNTILLSQRIHPLKMSKYCIGTALTTPGLKQNRFKAKIRKIEKIITNN